MFDRFFKRKTEDGQNDELKVNTATVGLCFDFERGLAYDSEYLSDVGMSHILKTLQSLNLRATFNCPAKLCETAPDQLAMIAEGGHEICILGYAGESPRDLTDDAVKQLIYSCRAAFGRRGLHPIGFRSPKSHWDERVCRELARQKFCYSAEHDHAKTPYIIAQGDHPLFRIPIYTDDRGLRRGEDTYDTTVSKHHRLVRKALARGNFVSICFHPWILAEDLERMDHWEVWLNTALRGGAKVGAMEDVLPMQFREPQPLTEP